MARILTLEKNATARYRPNWFIFLGIRPSHWDASQLDDDAWAIRDAQLSGLINMHWMGWKRPSSRSPNWPLTERSRSGFALWRKGSPRQFAIMSRKAMVITFEREVQFVSINCPIQWSDILVGVISFRTMVILRKRIHPTEKSWNWISSQNDGHLILYENAYIPIAFLAITFEHSDYFPAAKEPFRSSCSGRTFSKTFWLWEIDQEHVYGQCEWSLSKCDRTDTVQK